MRSSWLALAVVAVSSPACIVLDGCEDLTVDGEGGGPSASSGSTASGPASGSSANGEASGGASSTQVGPGGTGGAGAGGGPECLAAEICGIDAAADEDCDDEDPCPTDPAWTWLDLGDDVSVLSSDWAPGVHVVSGTIGDSATFVSARDPETGAELWTRTWEPAAPVLVLARVPTLVVIAGTVTDEVQIDDSTTLGAPGKVYGFVVTMNDDTGATESTLQFDETGGNTYATALEYLDASPPRLLVGVSHDLEYPLGAGNGTNAFIANLSPGLDDEIRVPVFADADDYVFPTSIATNDSQVAVAITTRAPAQRLDGGMFDAPLGRDSPAVQLFEATGGSGTTLDPVAFHGFVGVGELTRIEAVDLESTGALHVVIATDDAAALRIDGEQTDLVLDAASLHVGFDTEGTRDALGSLGTGILHVGGLAILDVGQTLLLSGVTREGGGEVAGMPITGPFLAELALVGSAEAPRWVFPLGDAIAATVPGLRVESREAQPDRVHVAGSLEGTENLSGTSSGALQAYVAELTR